MQNPMNHMWIPVWVEVVSPTNDEHWEPPSSVNVARFIHAETAEINTGSDWEVLQVSSAPIRLGMSFREDLAALDVDFEETFLQAQTNRQKTQFVIETYRKVNGLAEEYMNSSKRDTNFEDELRVFLKKLLKKGFGAAD